MNEQQLLKLLGSLVELSDAYLRMPTPRKAVILCNEIRNKIKPVYDRLNAPAQDVTQTNFLDAVEGK